MPTKDNAVTGYAQQILTQVRKAVVGKDQVLLWVLAAILARGHILLEDLPGTGKTTLINLLMRFYDVNEVVGSLNFNNFMHSTKVDFYFYPTAALAFNVGAEYASKDFVAVTSNPIFGNLAGLEANGNAGAKAGVTYVADTFIVTGDVIALCSMPESGFQFSGFQYDLSVIYNIFYDFQLSFGTYGFIDSAEKGKNNNFGMNLNLSLSF